MSDDTSQVPLDGGQETWDLLAARIEGLIERWESATEAPSLAEFVPSEPGPLRRLILVELIKVDLDYRYQRQQPRRIEDYVREFPELTNSRGVPSDLIFEEFQIRRRFGEEVDPGEYYQRFPSQIEELQRLLQISAPTELSTSHRRSKAYTEINVGDRVDDFDLQALLGEGAFARVFLAWQRSLLRRVALKVSADKGDEPQTLAQLDHPHIVRVYDQREIPDRQVRLLYMPYLPGGTLHDVLKLVRSTPPPMRSGQLLLNSVDAALTKRGEPIPSDSVNRQRLARMTWAEAVCYLGARLAEALDYAHNQGVLHRDIKPANVLLSAEGLPMLADFNVGVSSKIEGASPSAFFGGSLPYMAPEQIEAFNPAHPRQPESLDGRCDIFALGVTLWELLTGRRPFIDERVEGSWSDTLPLLVERRAAGPDREAQSHLPTNMPPGLRDVLFKSLAADPDQRYATAAEFARQLNLCLKPTARQLLYPDASWRKWVRRHPLIAMYLTGMIPASLASLFSIAHNYYVIVRHHPDLFDTFMYLVWWVNGTLFPIGFVSLWLLLRPVLTALRQAMTTGGIDNELAEKARRRSLWIGLAGAFICLSGFVLGGFIFPIGLGLDFNSTLHFLAAQVLCGLISFSYPLVAANFLAQHCLYPAFLAGPELPPGESARLRRLDWLLTIGLIMSALVPLLSVGFLAGVSRDFQWGMIGLSAAGAAAFALVYAIVGQARADTQALLELDPTQQ